MDNRIQTWFDQMVRGLAKQEWQRALVADADARCTYRSTDGRKCAIGQIIPDNAPCIRTNYTANFLRSAGRLKDLGLGDISTEEIRFLNEAQASHDNYETPEQIKKNFTDLGRQFYLNWPTEVPR